MAAQPTVDRLRSGFAAISTLLSEVQWVVESSSSGQKQMIVPEAAVYVCDALFYM